MTLSLEAANFVGLFVETMLFGVLFIAVGHCLKLLLLESGQFLLRERRDIKWWAVSITVCMFVISIADLILNFRLNMNTLLPANQLREPSVGYQVPGWVSVARITCYIIQAVLADIVLVIRLYAVYGKRWVFKAVLLSLVILTAIAGTVFLIVFVAGYGTVWGIMPRLVEMVMIGMDILLNAIATALIVRKLWMAHVAVLTFSLSPKKWLLLIRIIIESGLMYIFAQVTVLVSGLFGDVVICFSSAAGSILAISSILILIRTHDMLQKAPAVGNSYRDNFRSDLQSTETAGVTVVDRSAEGSPKTMLSSPTDKTVVSVDDLETNLSSTSAVIPPSFSSSTRPPTPPTVFRAHPSSHSYW